MPPPAGVKPEGQRWEKPGEIRASLERVQRRRSHQYHGTIKAVQPKPSGRLQPPLLHRLAPTDPAGTDFYLHQVKGTGCFTPRSGAAAGMAGMVAVAGWLLEEGGRLAARGGWQAAAHQLRSQGQSPSPSEDAYL